MRYLDFLASNGRFLAFGFLLTFASSFGQTFYVALFGAELRAEFALTNTAFGTIFSGATIAGAVLIVWLGRLIDRVDLRIYTACAAAALVLALVLIGIAPNLWLFVPALFLLRLTGQGLMPHISNTAMARYFDADRGKAVSVTSLGMPAGEALLPIIAVAMIGMLGWREAWLAVAVVFAVAVALALPFLLKGHAARHAGFEARLRQGAGGASPARAWTGREVLRDPRYIAVTSLFLAYPFIGTGLFFHQAYIAQSQGWPLELMAGGFVLFALGKVAMSLAIGPVVDRYGAVRLFPTIALPMVAVLAVLALFEDAFVPFAYLGLFGLGSGMLQPMMSGFLAELYGVANYGSIRAVSSAIMVLSTAVAPAAFGGLFDAGIGIAMVALGGIAYTLVAAGFAWAVPRRPVAAARTVAGGR